MALRYRGRVADVAAPFAVPGTSWRPIGQTGPHSRDVGPRRSAARASPSQLQQPVLRWEAPGREGAEDVATVDREERAELFAMRGEDAPVVRRVGHQQQEDVRAAVADLQR